MAWHPSAMGFLDLPKPLGVFHVAFADFELRTYASDSDVKAGGDAPSRRGAVSEVHDDDDDDVERKEREEEEDEETCARRVEISCRTPMVRLFYPTETKPKWSFSHAQTRRWLPELRYTYGFFSKSILPTSWLRRCFLWVLACEIFILSILARIFLLIDVSFFRHCLVGFRVYGSVRASSAVLFSM